MIARALSSNILILVLLAVGFGVTGCEGEKLPPVGKLIAQLQSDNPNVRKSAAVKLGKHGPGAISAISALLDAADDEDKGVYDAVVLALSKTGRKAVPELIKGLRRPEQRVSWAAMTALAWLGKDSVPALIEALQDSDDHVRDMAATGLAALGPQAKSAIPALLETAAGRYGSASSQALVALSKMGQPAVPGLVQLLEDPKMVPRRIDILRSIGHIGPAAKSAVPNLLSIIREDGGKVRLTAIRALGQIGTEAKAAIPSLMRLENSGQAQVAEVATKALNKIAPDR